MKLNLAYSPCPNDTFIFYKMYKESMFNIYIHDVEYLNNSLDEEKYDISKVSFYKWLNLNDKYELLKVGSAMGNGCGPILIGRGDKTLTKESKIAIPGKNTTAHLLFQLCYGDFGNKQFMTYDKVINSLVSNDVDFAIIIHESRFVYQSMNLIEIKDLGKWWEKETNLPIPLDVLLLEKNLGKEVISKIEHEIEKSINYAYANKEEVLVYVKEHAQELDLEVINSHIKTYVNDFTINLGKIGERSVAELQKRANEQGIIK